MIVDALLKWHVHNRRWFPWRDESDPYKIFIAEFFLQRTPAERVAKIYPLFVNRYPTPYILEQENPSQLVEQYKSLG